MKQQPDWLNRELYPFTSRWITIEGQEIHYVDEGSGPIILFVHGTPEWSFGYRDLIKILRKDYRCIAPDMLGFGLSDKPISVDYSVAAHARRLENFIQAMSLENLILVANDFGGGIGLNHALNKPENVSHVILFNSWMWSLKEDKHFARPAMLINSWLGRLLYLKFSFAVKVLLPEAFGEKHKLNPAIHAHYKNVFPNAASRMGTYTFARELMNASGWWQSNWDRMSQIKDKPFLIGWGMKDKFIPVHNLEKWKDKLPDAEVIMFKDAGHFVQEEQSEEMARVMMRFLGKTKGTGPI